MVKRKIFKQPVPEKPKREEIIQPPALVHKDNLTEDDRDAATRLAVAQARDDLLAFVMLMDPYFSVGPHHRLICDELMKVEAGEIDRLMIFVQPRSSKSLISSVYFPAWVLGRHGRWQILTVSHSVDLSMKFGRAVRDLLSTPEYQAVFSTSLKKGQGAADYWATTEGGEFKSAGAGTKIAGHGANLGIIDDPISEQDAWSKAAREKVNDWYPGGFRSRLMPGGRVVIIQTRWHENDLSGTLLKLQKESDFADKWAVVKIPALNTTQSANDLNDAADRLIAQGYLPKNYPMLEVGESFWPAPAEEDGYYWSTEDVVRTKHNTPPYQWFPIYMQEPSALEGAIIKAKYWKFWEHNVPPNCNYILMSMDTAFSTKESADYSAITVWGIFDRITEIEGVETKLPNMVLLGARKDHWSYPKLRETAMEYYERFRPDAVIVEDKASGQSLIQDLRLAGVPVIPYRPDRDKEARAHASTSLFYNGRVWVPEGKTWAEEVIEECRVFPNSEHDDFVDTVTQAVIWMKNGGQIIPTDSPWMDDEDQREQWESKRRSRKFY